MKKNDNVEVDPYYNLREADKPYRYPAQYKKGIDVDDLDLTLNQYIFINCKSEYKSEDGYWKNYETIKIRVSRDGTPIIVLEKDSKARIHRFDDSGEEVIPEESKALLSL